MEKKKSVKKRRKYDENFKGEILKMITKDARALVQGLTGVRAFKKYLKLSELGKTWFTNGVLNLNQA